MPTTEEKLDCARYLSFVVEKVSNVSPDESEGITHYSQLDVAEQLMLPPTARRCSVETCIYPDGTFESTVQMLPASGLYTYPDYMAGVGVHDKPLFHRAVFDRTGKVIYYDASGKEINTNYVEPETIVLQFLLVSLSKVTKPLSQDELQQVWAAFANAGYPVDSLPGQDLVTVDQPLDDGFSRVYFDTKRYLLVGQEDYDASGELRQGYRLYVSGEIDDFKVVGHEFRTSFISPFSNIKMNIFRRSRITNFVME